MIKGILFCLLFQTFLWNGATAADLDEISSVTDIPVPPGAIGQENGTAPDDQNRPALHNEILPDEEPLTEGEGFAGEDYYNDEPDEYYEGDDYPEEDFEASGCGLIIPDIPESYEAAACGSKIYRFDDAPEKAVKFYSEFFNGAVNAPGYPEGDMTEEGQYMLGKSPLKLFQRSEVFYHTYPYMEIEGIQPGYFDAYLRNEKLPQASPEEMEKLKNNLFAPCLDRVFESGKPFSAVYSWVQRVPGGWRQFRISVEGSLNFLESCGVTASIRADDITFKYRNDAEAREKDSREEIIKAVIDNMESQKTVYGAPKYPGSKLLKKESAAESLERTWAPDEAAVIILETEDSPDKAAGFYRDAGLSSAENNSYIFSLEENPSITVLITTDEKSGKTLIFISEFFG